MQLGPKYNSKKINKNKLFLGSIVVEAKQISVDTKFRFFFTIIRVILEKQKLMKMYWYLRRRVFCTIPTITSVKKEKESRMKDRKHSNLRKI